jgi:MFS transporter, DHA1 family, tetracycline resistance protein
VISLPLNNNARRKAAVPFILLTILIDMLGIGLVIPVLPKLVAEMHGSTISEGAQIYGWFVASYALMQFLFAPILGNLSDAYGRRPVLLFSLLGTGIDYLLMAWAPDLMWLFIGRIISGITGANITAANAYIADVSRPEDRARNFGMVGACFGLGFIIGPAVGGFLGDYGLRVPFIGAAILTTLNWLYGLFVLPESHAIENRRAFRMNRINPFRSLEVLTRFPVVRSLVAIIALDRLAHAALPSTWVLYTTYRFGWGEKENGLSLALVGLMFAIVQGGLTGRVVKRIGESRAIIFGLSIAAVAYLSYGFASYGWIILLTIVFASLGGVAGPSLQGLVSRSVPADEQGAVQGALTSINGIAAILGPLLATNLFSYFTSKLAPVHVPGAAFFMSSALVFAAALLAIARSQREKASAAVAPQVSEAT